MFRKILRIAALFLGATVLAIAAHRSYFEGADLDIRAIMFGVLFVAYGIGGNALLPDNYGGKK